MVAGQYEALKPVVGRCLMAGFVVLGEKNEKSDVQAG